MTARKAKWLVKYENTDVSDELQSMITSVEYSDAKTGTADELQITVDDRDHRWRQGWFPSGGDRISVQFGWEGQPLIDTGEFKVDEIEASGPPHVITIRALAVPMSSDLRTAKSRSFEETTLRAILTSLATELQLELLGDVPDVAILRTTQNNVTTVAFMARLAREYGYAFSIRPPQLVFYELAKLEGAEASFTLHERDLGPGYSLKAGLQGTYAACEVRWFDPADLELRVVIVYADHARQRIVLGGQEEGTANALSATAPAEIPTRVLQHRSPMQQGEDVRGWQFFLLGQGFEPGPIDGKFGALSTKGTKGFQAAHGLTIDGKAGPDTFRVAVEAGFGQPGGLLDGGPTRAEVAGPILRHAIKVETVEQGEIMARALLAEANRLRATGSLNIEGNPYALAGANFELIGMDRYDGKYSVESSKHTMTRAGWSTSIEVAFV